MMTNDAVLALQRFGLGAKPGQLRSLSSNLPARLKSSLRTEEALLPASNLPSTRDNLHALDRFRAERKQADAASMDSGNGDNGMDRVRSPRDLIYLAEIEARLIRMREVEIGIVERLTSFWANHFAVSARKGRIQVMVGSFEREAIRPHVKSRFVDMLKAAMSHPAMLSYLDNNRSVGPASPRGQNKSLGLNENLARELLELHTLGVNGGYKQNDVTETAKILTGWSFHGTKAKQDAFTFAYMPRMHEPGPKTVLGMSYGDGGKEEAHSLFDDLAVHPATARHLATKLARHFVADDPSDALISALEKAFLESEGDLLPVYDVLLDHPASWEEATVKLRSPQEWMAAASRCFDADFPAHFVSRSLATMGHRFWSPASPKGFGDRREDWLSGSMIKARVNTAARIADRFSPSTEPLVLAEQTFGEKLSEETVIAMRQAATRKQAFEIMLLAPEMMRR